MKNIALSILFGITALHIQAQNSTDALRYGQDNMNGSARFRSMGGALGAIGSDLSSLAINPAGSAFLQNKQVSFSLTNFNKKNETNFYGSDVTRKPTSLDLNQFGVAWVLKNTDESSKWGNIALAINYESTNNFNNKIQTRGYNPSNSYDQYFISYANGMPLNDFTGTDFTYLNYRQQQAYMGYEGYLFNEGPNNTYVPATDANGNLYQTSFMHTKGFNSKVSFNAAIEYDQRFYFGLNLNAHTSDYTMYNNLYEDRYEAFNNNEESGVQAFRFENRLATYGSGFSFQLGGIAKVTNNFRVGVSYESPTWYRFEEEITQSLVVDCPDCFANSNVVQVTPNATMIFAPYKLQTPGKVNGSLAYFFGEKGSISFDYSRKDYSNMRFKPKNQFIYTNNTIDENFIAANEFRFGGEYNIKKLSLRAGYRFEESPYKNKDIMSDLSSYSTGLGYNFDTFSIDLSYTYLKRDFQYTPLSDGFTDTANVKANANNITLSVLFQL